MSDESKRYAMRRRPLLTPVVIVVLVGFAVLGATIWTAMGFWQQPGVVVVVRHAEKSAQPDENPPLSAAGERRGQGLADMFASSGIEAVFATEYLRSFSTAAPLAQRLSLPVHIYDARDTEGVVARINADHRYDVVLVVGHSNTVPEIVRALSGRSTGEIRAERFGDVFVIVRPRWGRAKLIRLYQPLPGGT